MELPKQYLAACLKVLVDTSRVCYMELMFKKNICISIGNETYNGTWDAGRKIYKTEGFKGLYRGFFVSVPQVVSGLCYVSTYEMVRHLLENNLGIKNNKTKAFVGGGAASIGNS